ncbi:ImmA/IrrE family metallo-endopeptidase [Streptomyces sp. NPDC102384]|uniref:ImmA/IrrE family metallo-endopeptidase n=1 Tax=Streptomyces sp. NPDC102384 TaxID=3366166 RepID=UPI0037F8FA4A
MTVIPEFTGKRLVLARHRRRMTLAALARTSKLTTHSLTHFENRLKYPSPQSLDRLARALDVTPEFLQAPPPQTILPEAMSLRSPTRLTARKRYSAVAVAELSAACVAWIETYLWLPCPNLPSWPQMDPEHAAEDLRAHWHMGDAPSGPLTPLLESHGIRIFALPPDCDDVGAFSTRQSGTPFVFLPSHLDGQQARQHLAYELGQLVLGPSRPGHRDSRTAALQFATAFLMPRTGVMASMLRAATPERLAAAANTWGVSTSAVLHRLHDLELLPEWSHRTTAQELGGRTGPSSSPGSTSVECSHMLPKVVAYLRARRLPIESVAELTALRTDDPPCWPTMSGTGAPTTAASWDPSG